MNAVKAVRKLISLLGAAAMIAAMSPVCSFAEEIVDDNTLEYRDDPDMYIPGKIYEYDEKHDYTVSSFYYLERSSELETLGQLSVTGSFIGTATEENITALEVGGSENFSFSYIYSNSLFNSDKFNWHIVSDSTRKVDGIDLGGSIGTGAVVIETSPDREHWTLSERYLDILRIPEGSFDAKSYTVSSMQLTEGCYFRVIVAYKLEEQVDDTRFWFIDTSDKESKRVAEVYEFYAACDIQDTERAASNGNKLRVGETVYAGDHSSYSQSSEITYRDPHYGWNLGTFSLSGYTETLGDELLIKEPGEKVSLWFSLSQADLNKLHGDRDLSIKADTNGSDRQFGISGKDFGRGALIIRRTDAGGLAEEPQIISDFLASIDTPFTDTLVTVFEEGDYEAALDYRINEDGFFFDDQYDYRTSFKFSVRNRGCSVDLLDCLTGDNLNEAVSAENGFKLDSPSSRYLRMKVSLSQWTEKENGYTETHIFDRAPEENELFKEEGIYTVTAVNPTLDPAGGNPYIKKIYVGSDDVIRAYVSGKNEDMTVNMIADIIKKGGTVDEDGTVIPPPEEESSSEAEKPERVCPIAAADTSDTSAAPVGTTYEKPTPSFPLIPLLCAAATVGAAVFFLYVGRQEEEDE